MEEERIVTIEETPGPVVEVVRRRAVWHSFVPRREYVLRVGRFELNALMTVIALGLSGCIACAAVGLVFTLGQNSAASTSDATATAIARAANPAPPVVLVVTATPRPGVIVVTATPVTPPIVVAGSASQPLHATINATYDQRVRVGDTMKWTFTVQNTGPGQLDGFRATMNNTLKNYTLIECIPKCTVQQVGDAASVSFFTFAGTVPVGQVASYTISLSPNEPGNVQLIWAFGDSVGKELLAPDGSNRTIAGDVAIVR